MNGTQTTDTTKDVDEVLAEYLQAREGGTPIEPEALMDRYPQFADEIRQFLEDEQRAARALRPLGPDVASQDSQPPPDAAGAGAGPAEALPARFGEYELLEEIGRGGMGILYKARHRSLNRIVALKVILGGQFASPDDVRRFQVEARHAANLDHPNIVPVYDVGCHAGHHFFTMKLVAGGSLVQHRDRLGRNPRAAAALVATVARAVHHAHQRGLLHRDLKPGNILIDGDGRPIISDFGLARRIDGGGTLTQSGAMVGSPRYMSPEQAAGERSLTVATDVYALGVILYELLAGRPPFDAPLALETLQQVRTADPPRPSSWGRKVDRDLETICLKCLEKDPRQRYPSAEALAQDLDRWLRYEPIEARPAGAVMRMRRWTRRHPGATSVIAILAVALAIVTTLMYDNRQLARERQLMFERVRAQYITELDRLYEYAGVGDLPPVEIPPEYRALHADMRVGTKPDLAIRFGVYMRDTPTKMLEEIDPALTELEQALAKSLRKDVGITFIMYPEARGRTSYENAREALLDREVDFMRMGPASYVEARRDPRGQGLGLLGRHRVEGHRAGIYTRQGSGITDFEGLRGKPFAFQDLYSTTTVFTKAVLLDNGIRAADLGPIIYRDNAKEVRNAIGNALADAGSFNRTLVKDEHRFELLGQPFELFGQLWVTRPDLEREDPALFKALRAGVLGFSADVARAMGEDIRGLVAVDDDDLAPVITKVDKAERFDGTNLRHQPAPAATRPSSLPSSSRPAAGGD